MRTLTSIFAIAALTLLTACDSSGRLAEKLQGTWSSSSEPLEATMGRTSAMYVYTFTRTDGTAGGTVALTAMVEAFIPAGTATDFGEHEIAASATATVQGTWQAVDDDEIILNLDLRSMTLSIDPSTVELNPPTEAPALETLKAGMAEQLKQDLRPALERKFMYLKSIDDIKVSGHMLRWEIDDVDQTLARDI